MKDSGLSAYPCCALERSTQRGGETNFRPCTCCRAKRSCHWPDVERHRSRGKTKLSPRHEPAHLKSGFLQPCTAGRKHDFEDAERLVRRLIANELILSFVLDGEQRTWRNMTRMKTQLTRDRCDCRTRWSSYPILAENSARTTRLEMGF